MEYRLLGPLEVVHAGRTLELGPPRQRAVLALLLLHADQVVAFDRIVDELWGERPPSTAQTLVHGYISGLRKVLEPGRGRSSKWEVVVTRPPGYVLVVDPGQVDIARFARLVETGVGLVADEPARASAVLDEALAMWRGPALADLTYEAFARHDIARLDELRLTALESRIDADLALGRHRELLGELTRLVADHPLRERLRGQLMVALYRSGRQAEALGTFENLRHALREELGLDPSPDLQELEHAILIHEEDLRRPPRRRRTNLPVQLTSFVGREEERGDVAGALVAGSRLVTLIGPGGGGKTRLAVEIAGSLLDEFVDGVWLAELAAVTDGALVPDAVAAAVGVRSEPGRSLAESLAVYVAHRGMLLVLDNAEHVIDATASLVHSLLRAGERCRVLVTSRESLSVPGERIYAVPPLPTPDAVQLFTERAQAAGGESPAFDPTSDAVIHICEELDGLPLAIELAAALTGSLTVEQIADRLGERLQLLTRGNRVAPTRHQTLAACVEWSYDLLTEDEQRVFDRLSVMAGPFAAEAADAVCAGQPVPEGGVLGRLAALVAASLVTREGGRYAMLETLRQYGAARLAERGEEDDVRERHARFYLALAEAREPLLYTAASGTALADLEAEQDQFRAALQWCFAGDAQRARLGAALAGLLGWPWHMWGALEEARTWLRAALEVTEGDRDRVRTRVLYGAAMVSSAAGAIDRAHEFYAATAELAAEVGDWELRSDAISGMASALWAKGDLDRAVAVEQEAVDAADAAGSLVFGAQHRALLARIRRDRGELDTAEPLLDQALTMSRQLGEEMTIGLVLDNLASLAAVRGDHQRAADLARESLVHYRAVPYREGVTSALHTLAAACTALGRFEEAEQAVAEGLALARRLGHLGSVASQLDGMSRIAAATGDPARAAVLVGAADGLRAGMAVARPRGEALAHDAFRRDLDERLGADAAARARERGATLTLDEAVTLALGSSPVAEPA